MDGNFSTVRKEGFTLLELMVVLGVLLLVAAMVIPAMGSLKRSLDLRTGASQLLDQLALARQTACTRNVPVEVRFYGDGNPPDSVALYTILADGSARALQKRFKLPDAVEISRSEKFSSLLQESLSGKPTVRTGDSAPSQSFRFIPNGTPNLTAPESPTLTLMLRTDDKGDLLPADFVTLRLDLQTGRIQIFRP